MTQKIEIAIAITVAMATILGISAAIRTVVEMLCAVLVMVQ